MENYTFVLGPIKKTYAFKKAQCCQINGVVYASLSQAGKALNLNHKTIKNRILSSKYENYVLINIIDRSNDYPEGE